MADWHCRQLNAAATGRFNILNAVVRWKNDKNSDVEELERHWSSWLDQPSREVGNSRAPASTVPNLSQRSVVGGDARVDVLVRYQIFKATDISKKKENVFMIDGYSYINQ